MDPRCDALADNLWDHLGVGSHPRCDEWNHFLWEWIDFMIVNEYTTPETVGELWDEYLESTEPPQNDYVF